MFGVLERVRGWLRGKRRHVGKREFARQMRFHPTKSEAECWELVKESVNGARPYFFRRQQVVCGYILDFYCRPLRLGVEVDGLSHAKRREYDVERTLNLNRRNVALVRFTNWEVWNRPEMVKRTLVEVCDAREKMMYNAVQ